MTIVLGGRGYVGSAIVRFFHRVGEPVVALGRREVDLTDPDRLTASLRKWGPDFLINAAGHTGNPNVDACEEAKTACLFANAVLPGIVREACENLDLPWGHVSSGCVYQGRGPTGSGFTEEDAPNFSFRASPCSFYSGTKALGEEVIADATRCYRWRIRMPFSHRDHPRNYLSKLLRYERLLDVENSLTRLEDFARVCYEFRRRELPPGTYNVTQPGSVTTREVVDLLRERIAPGRDFAFFRDEDEFLDLVANTPRSNCVLDGKKLSSAGIDLREVRQSLGHALASWETSS